MRARDRATPGAGPLSELIETQRVGCEMAGSPLYADLLDVVADEVAGGGACRRILEPFADAPFGDAVLLRFLAAVHLLVLEGAEPDLAHHYPSVGGRPGPDVGRAFVAAVERHEARIVELMGHGVQTNEVGRCAGLLVGFLALASWGLPLRILELGSSAGLNLRFDRYRYEAGEAAFGPADAIVRFEEPWAGRAPDLGRRVDVASRVGCDVEPIDPTSEAGRRRLRSLVWPDQVDRRARLDAAIAVAIDTADTAPVVVERADAVTWLRGRLATPVVGQLTVVVHSIVFQYLDAEARRALLGVLDEAGARAEPDAPLAWLRMEPGGDRAEIRLTTWPDGESVLLATSSFHGPPVVLAEPVRR